MPKNIKHLVVDTTAFIKAANLQDIAENIYTVQEVCDEITNDRQRRKLVVLPYDLKVKDVFQENIKFVTEFAKKTGDYTSLSATDIKVMALTYQLEIEKVGTKHLKNEPSMQKTIKITGLTNFNLHPAENKGVDSLPVSNDSKEMEERKPRIEENCNNKEDILSPEVEGEKPEAEVHTLHVNNGDNKNEIDDSDQLAKDITDKIQNMELKDIDDIMVKVEESDEEETETEEESDSDGGDWITPKNLTEKKKEVDTGEFEAKPAEVACITSDFAMQNVLKQIGLNITSIDGRIIRQLRTFIFRCTTCFKTTSVMTKLFCPKCGHATLKKVAVSIDDDGNQHIHINGKKPLTARGKRFSLPTPRGGQHFQYPILSEDQHIHKRFATKIGRSKTNALDPDYIAGLSPFSMRDVNSKSAVLGVRANKQDIKYWMKHYSKGKK
ncbi:RNA-binding protein NOB1 [Hyposmocoma kahamanoa]|uniref:RNA-binding protein NOB1 n=1 Tax=Hyposmocoma kahamanoa TaxID=1477025 RepID=UPI000E6D823B|nr:RNA-binding protein NOB1 [Hyposmocoma kahamanoa]